MNEIKQYRKIAKLSQKELAESLKVPQTTLSCWERNIGSPNIRQAFELSVILKVDIKTLFKINDKSL